MYQEQMNIGHLRARVQMAGLYREMCQTQGFADLKRELEARIVDLRNKWLVVTGDEAEKIRLRGQIYNEVFELVKSKILTGDMAAREINRLQEENPDLK